MAINWHLGRPEIIEELESLEILIQETDSSLLAFALYRSIGDREAAVRALKERLTMPVVEFTLSKEQRNPISLFQTLSVEERVCIFFYDVEEALPDLAGYVNLQREKFAEVPHAVIFWVREHGLREIATHAPDFWAWRSGVFNFRSEQFNLPLTVVQTALVEPLIFQDRGDLERRISLYQRLIREYSQQEKPDERFLAGLQVKLGWAYHLLGRFEQAETSSREALARSRRIGDKRAEAAALRTLGILAQEQWRLDEAEEKYRRSLFISEQIGDDAGLAYSYHQLGRIAQEWQQFDQAEQWYHKALEIFERLKLERYAAYAYHNLGIIAHLRQQFDEAEQWYHKALEIFECLELEWGVAYACHQLGMIVQEQQKFDEAEQWYHKALKIRERLGLERDAAGDYHQLGTIAQERQQLDEAEQWYRKALKIEEYLGLERDATDEYHHLGLIARMRQQFGEAEKWYRKALEIFELLGHPPLMVNTLAQLGALHLQQNYLHEAVSWFGKALVIAEEYNMPIGDQIVMDLARVINAMGEEEFMVAWQQAFEGQEPPLERIREVMRGMQGDDN